MNSAAIDNGASGGRLDADYSSAPHHGNLSMVRLDDDIVAISQNDQRIICLAKPACAFHNRLEHRTDFSRRGSDNPQDIGTTGLVRQRLGQISRPALQLFEEPYILDCDHGLVGKRGDEVDLLFRERLHALTSDYDRADRLILAQEGNAERRTLTSHGDRRAQPIFGIGSDVEDLHRTAFEHGTTCNRAPVGTNRVSLQKLDVFLGKPYRCSGLIFIAFAAHDECHLRFAQPCRRMDQRVEHGLQVEGRAADHLQHIGSRGLLLERFGEIARLRLDLIE